MEFKRNLQINRPIEAVWEVLGNQFGEAYRWGASLYHSEGYGEPKIPGAPFNNRFCETTIGPIREEVRAFDPVNHVLSYAVTEGFPSFVEEGVNTWTLTSEGPNQTRLDMHCVIRTKGVSGAVMTPLMKRQMNKLFDEVIEEFGYYLEHDGTPHPRKQRQKKKAAVVA